MLNHHSADADQSASPPTSRAWMEPAVRRRVYLWHAAANANQYDHFIINYAHSTIMQQVGVQ
jgi:hypothetical protein